MGDRGGPGPHWPGDFVVCNLASLCLGAIDVDDPDEVGILPPVLWALDNVIDLNFYPWPTPELPIRITEESVWESAVYHHMLAKHGIRWESEGTSGLCGPGV